MNNKKELIANIFWTHYIRKNDERSPTARHFQLAAGSVVTGNGGWAVEKSCWQGREIKGKLIGYITVYPGGLNEELLSSCFFTIIICSGWVPRTSRKLTYIVPHNVFLRYSWTRSIFDLSIESDRLYHLGYFVPVMGKVFLNSFLLLWGLALYPAIYVMLCTYKNTYTNKYKSTTEQVPVCPSALLLVMSTYAEESHWQKRVHLFLLPFYTK